VAPDIHLDQYGNIITTKKGEKKEGKERLGKEKYRRRIEKVRKEM